jgi:lipopolysaccharide transport system ATP-binding protein
MTDIALRVENLSKRYRIGLREEQHETLFGAAASWLRSPVENDRRLKKRSRFEKNGGAGVEPAGDFT